MLRTLSLCCVVGVTLLGAAAAQPRDDRTYLTFSGPVQLPTTRLAAGTYTFRLLDSASNRHIIQVLDRDGLKLVTTVLAIAAERREPAEDTVVTFAETPANTAPAVRFWFYPGDRIGHEFVYPRSQAAQIAKASGESVVATRSEATTPDAMRSAELTRIDPSGRETAYNDDAAAQTTSRETAEPRSASAATQSSTSPAPNAAASRPAAPATRDLGQSTAARAPQPAAQIAQADTTLPQTASVEPLLALLGVLLLGAGLLLTVRQARACYRS